MRFLYKILHRLFPKLIFFVENSEAWYLTIDDSPSQDTPWILDILDRYQVKANFFCIGENIEKFPVQFAQIIERGHAVGYHSYAHKNAFKMPFSSWKSDFEMNLKQFESNLYRPPYGKLTWRAYRHIFPKYKIILYDILAEDWNPLQDPIKTIQSKLNSAQNGSIFVFHDNMKSKDNMKKMLPYFLEYAKSNQKTISNIMEL